MCERFALSNTMRSPIAPGLISACLLTACSRAVPSPDAVVDAYVSAVEREDWVAAYRALDGAALGFASEADFVAYGEQHSEALRDQARALADARRLYEASVQATLPLVGAEDVRLIEEGGRWALLEHAPLNVGGDDPASTLRALVGLLRSDELRAMLGLLDGPLRQRYLSEVDELARLLEEGSEARVEVYGDRATVELGEIMIRLTRSDGVWKVANIEQPYSYGDYYEPYW